MKDRDLNYKRVLAWGCSAFFHSARKAHHDGIVNCSHADEG